MGRAAQAGDPPDDRRGAARRGARDGAGDRRSRLRRGEAAPRRPKPPLFADLPTTSCSATACRPSGSTTSARRPRTRCWTSPTTCPAEAAEALLELATGGTPRVPAPSPAGADPFEHPDAQRRFRVMTNVEELRAGARLPVGEVDGLPPPRPARSRSSATTAARRASPARPAPARRSWRCTAPSSWRARTPTRACC